jgi:hypothetical protein
MIQGLPVAQADSTRVTFVSTQVGTWKPIDERSIHVTGVQLHADANGTLVGTVTIDAHPTLSKDGQTLIDDNSESGPTIRDEEDHVVDILRGSPPATGVRMCVGSPSPSVGARPQDPCGVVPRREDRDCP